MAKIYESRELEEQILKYNEELDKYFLTLNPYDYTNETWDEIKNKIEEKRKEISEFDCKPEKANEYFEELFENLKKEISELYSLKSQTMTNRERVLKNIRDITEKVFLKTKSIWDQIKFIFAIPGCTFASFTFTILITLVLNSFLNMLIPYAYSDDYYGVVQAIIASGIYIAIRFAIIRDVYLNQVEIDIKVYLLKHFFATLFWWVMFFGIRYAEASIVGDFSYFEWAIYLPYLTIGAFTHEFFISCIITYSIIHVIVFAISLLYIKRMEETFDVYEAIQKRKEREEKLNKNKVVDDSYEYRFVYKEEYGLSEDEELKAKKIRKRRSRKQERKMLKKENRK